MATLNIEQANPFESLGSLMSVLASDTTRGNTSGQFYEHVIRLNELDPGYVKESAMILFLECKRILQLPFLPQHNSAVESHVSYLDSLYNAFFRLAFSYESMRPCDEFRAAWDGGRWSIMSQSVKSFRNEYQNYQLIEFVKRYLNVLHHLLNESEETESVIDALEILTDILNSLDEKLWKSGWEEIAGRFATLDGLLRTESEGNPDSPLSNFYTATREAVWKVVYHTSRVADAVLFVPKADAALNIGLAFLASNVLPPESVEVVKEFMGVMAQLPTSNSELNIVPSERDALPESTVATQVD